MVTCLIASAAGREAQADVRWQRTGMFFSDKRCDCPRHGVSVRTGSKRPRLR